MCAFLSCGYLEKRPMNVNEVQDHLSGTLEKVDFNHNFAFLIKQIEVRRNEISCKWFQHPSGNKFLWLISLES